MNFVDYFYSYSFKCLTENLFVLNSVKYVATFMSYWERQTKIIQKVASQMKKKWGCELYVRYKKHLKLVYP